MALGYVLTGRIYHIVYIVFHRLYHICRRPVVSSYGEGMVLPGLQIVERKRVGVLRRKLGITERHHRRIARVLETVELSAPRTAQTTSIVELELRCLGERVIEEQAREQLEIIFLERCVAQ